MLTGNPTICEIPLDQLENVEDFALNVLHMDRETVMEDFDDVFESTLERSMRTLSCMGMFEVFPIQEIRETEIEFEGGTTLHSTVLPKMLACADAVALYAVTVHGFDKLAKDPNNDVFDGMFFNAWSIGVSMAGHRWIKQRIEQCARDADRFVGRSWTPGEGQLELSLQEPMFNLLNPSRIGIALTETKMMSPLMSVSGLIGLSDDPAIQGIGIDIPTFH